MKPKTEKGWKTSIKKLLEGRGTNTADYAHVIETLAGILAERDAVYAAYLAAGALPVLEHVNKSGARNMVKNPMLVMWDELNKTALVYWRELGLTPASYKKLTGDSPKKEMGGGLAAALADLGAG